ncbi:MAG: radical SAM protein [Candidatus Omnitrophica bacterium]|nr:radical SAM protein [Candidatus Omnitrophota bacterium]MDD5080270.1 radical SAM protein [Candidatus Omnitrophota bacterium]
MLPLRNLKRSSAKAVRQPLYAVKVLAKRSKAYLSYWLYPGKSSLPEAITLFLTYRCNLHCKMCGQWGDGGVTRKQGQGVLSRELGLEELKRIVDDSAYFKPNITLFGGEPLLFPGCAELIRHIKQKGRHCLMITNGSLLAEFAERIVEAGLDELNVSLDGAGKLHDDIRGMPGLFGRIMEGLQKVNSIKAGCGRKSPLINLQCTITRYNYRNLEEMLEVAKQAKANSLTFHNLIFLSREMLGRQRACDELLACSSRDWEGFVFEPGIDPQYLFEKEKEILGQKYGFSVDFYPNFSSAELSDYYNNTCYRPPASNCRCLSPWLSAYIFPDGELRPCLNLTYSFGNVKKESLIKLWNNSRAIHFRRILKTNKIFPACGRCTELYRY